MNIKYFGMITESNIRTNSYGCLMAMFPKQYADKIISFGNRMIQDSDLYIENDDFGRTLDPHVTIKYGFKPDLNEFQIRKILKDIHPFTINAVELGKFQTNPKFDVVKFSVESSTLRELNKRCCEYPNSDEYPAYSPHSTIAYVKKGKVGIGNGSIKITVPINTICYSPIIGEKSYYNLT